MGRKDISILFPPFPLLNTGGRGPAVRTRVMAVAELISSLFPRSSFMPSRVIKLERREASGRAREGGWGEGWDARIKAYAALFFLSFPLEMLSGSQRERDKRT